MLLFYHRSRTTINDFERVLGKGWNLKRANIEIINVTSWPAYILGPFWPKDWYFVSEPLYKNKVPTKIPWLNSQRSIEIFDQTLAAHIGPDAGIGLGRSHFYQQGY